MTLKLNHIVFSLGFVVMGGPRNAMGGGWMGERAWKANSEQWWKRKSRLQRCRLYKGIIKGMGLVEMFLIWMLALSHWRQAWEGIWYGYFSVYQHFHWLRFTWEMWEGKYLHHVNSSSRFIKSYDVTIAMIFLLKLPLF